MGGYGSGRPEDINRKETTANVHAVDVLAWNKKGFLVPGASFDAGNFFWDSSGPALHIDAYGSTGQAQYLEVEHRWHEHRLREEIAVEWTACHYGGARPWFVCARCDERARLLYLEADHPDGLLLCRQCHGLAYECQRQDFCRRRAETAKRLRQKVGGWFASGLLTPFPARPKGMHKTTYERARAAATEAQMDWLVLEMEHNKKVSAFLRKRFPAMDRC